LIATSSAPHLDDREIEENSISTVGISTALAIDQLVGIDGRLPAWHAA
jgi:hypothetical protein